MFNQCLSHGFMCLCSVTSLFKYLLTLLCLEIHFNCKLFFKHICVRVCTFSKFASRANGVHIPQSLHKGGVHHQISTCVGQVLMDGGGERGWSSAKIAHYKTYAMFLFRWVSPSISQRTRWQEWGHPPHGPFHLQTSAWRRDEWSTNTPRLCGQEHNVQGTFNFKK